METQRGLDRGIWTYIVYIICNIYVLYILYMLLIYIYMYYIYIIYVIIYPPPPVSKHHRDINSRKQRISACSAWERNSNEELDMWGGFLMQGDSSSSHPRRINK